MNMVTRNNIFERYLVEYLGAGMKRKSAILDHVVDVTQMHRKAAIRKFHVLQLDDSAQPEILKQTRMNSSRDIPQVS